MTDNRYVTEGQECILAIYFNSRGYGFTVMKNPLEVIEKGMKCITPVDNTEVLKKVRKLIRRIQPERIIIEDHQGKGSNKSKRVIELLNKIKQFAKQKDIPLSAYSREQIRLVFGNWHASTRYEIAEVIARNVDAYKNLLFDKPKYPSVEHFRSAQFDSASLGITHYYLTQ